MNEVTIKYDQIWTAYYIKAAEIRLDKWWDNFFPFSMASTIESIGNCISYYTSLEQFEMHLPICYKP